MPEQLAKHGEANLRTECKIGPPMLAAFALLALLGNGCSLRTRGAVAENVISARELSLSGEAALQDGRWNEAEVLFSQAIKTFPTDERTHSLYAQSLWRQGETDKAIEHMQEAVKLSGGDARLLVELGQMYLILGHVDRASPMADRAIASNCRLASAWALQGDILYHRRQLDEATASYHRALSFQPHYPHAQLSLARIYDQTNRPLRTLTTLEVLGSRYCPGTEPVDLLVLQGLTFKKLGQYTRARESLAAATRRAPPSAELQFHLAEAHLLAGDDASARMAVEGALRLQPNHEASQSLASRLGSRLPNTAAKLLPPVQFTQ